MLIGVIIIKFIFIFLLFLMFNIETNLHKADYLVDLHVQVTNLPFIEAKTLLLFPVIVIFGYQGIVCSECLYSSFH